MFPPWRRKQPHPTPLPVGEGARRAGEAKLILALITLSGPLFAAQRPQVVNDIPVPFNAQAVATNHAVTLTWQWQPPEKQPDYSRFEFEVRRNDGFSATVQETTYSDFDLAFGTYSYKVRARGNIRSEGKRTLHVSDWSEPVGATVQEACTRAPSVTLSVQSTQKTYSDIPSLRLHLSGQVRLPAGCSLTNLTYHIETDTAQHHSGPLKADARGRFDDYVEAIGPDDEIPTGGARFTVSVVAEDEAGPATSDAYAIDMQLRNRYAPQ